jgi:RNA polymerase sigma-70 factor (ECF subfamily)
MMRAKALVGRANRMHPAETATVEVTIEKTVLLDPTLWLDEHGDYLFRYALSRLRDEVAAEDCVQEALLSAIESIGAYSGRSTERTWLVGILKHNIIDHFRRTARERPFADNGPEGNDFDEFFQPDGRWKDHWNYDLMPTDWGPSPEEAIEQSEFRLTFQRCLGKLPLRVAGAFALREMEGLDTDTICDILQLSAANFWVMMHRARMGLRRCMELNWFKKA